MMGESLERLRRSIGFLFDSIIHFPEICRDLLLWRKIAKSGLNYIIRFPILL
jgi:hypothetical protein